MSDCIHCKCDDIPINKDTCTKLQSDNTNKIRDFAIYYRDLQTCNLAEEGAKGFYNVWCMFKNLIAYTCWLASKIKDFKAGTNITFTPNADGSTTISAKDTTYTAGTGISITGTTISATPNDLSGYVTKDEYNELATAFTKALRDIFYPIGSIFQSTVNTDPTAFIGGTWERFGNGRVLVGVDEADSDFSTPNRTGGAKTHTLTIAEIPSHTHGQVVTANDTGSAIRRDYVSDGSASIYSQGVTTQPTGGGESHNNLQPYITVYMWRRTA